MPPLKVLRSADASQGQMPSWQLFPGVKGEVYLVEKQFGLDSQNAYGEF
jgi:hypothetical protein